MTSTFVGDIENRPVGLDAVHMTEVSARSENGSNVHDQSTLAPAVHSNGISTTQSVDGKDTKLTRVGELQRFDLDLDSIDSDDLMQGELYLSQQVGILDFT